MSSRKGKLEEEITRYRSRNLTMAKFGVKQIPKDAYLRVDEEDNGETDFQWWIQGITEDSKDFNSQRARIGAAIAFYVLQIENRVFQKCDLFDFLCEAFPKDRKESISYQLSTAILLGYFEWGIDRGGEIDWQEPQPEPSLVEDLAKAQKSKKPPLPKKKH